MTNYAISEMLILVTSELQDKGQIMQSKLIINSGKVVVILAMGGGWAVWVVAWCVEGTLGGDSLDYLTFID